MNTTITRHRRVWWYVGRHRATVTTLKDHPKGDATPTAVGGIDLGTVPAASVPDLDGQP